MPNPSHAARLRACVVMDYQNVHFTARDAFATPGARPEDCLIHPARFAERVLAVRDLQLDPSQQGITDLARVRTFRGSPSNAKQPGLYRIMEKHRSEWTRDRRIEVTYRTIKYPPGWPKDRAREKGVDVLVALAFVREDLAATFDVVILASHDTDMEPALEMAVTDGRCAVETAGWAGERVLRVSGFRTRHTRLNAGEFDGSRDRRDYG